MKIRLIIFGAILALLWLFGNATQIQAQISTFTYHGRLADGSNSANGSYDLRFALFEAASEGNQIGSALTNTSMVVNAGIFTATLDFGAGAFPGTDRWLQIGVRSNGSANDFIILYPRQALTATPYAVTAGDVAVGANIARLFVPNTATQATGMPTISFGFLVNVSLTSGGSGYQTPPPVTVSDPTGSGAIITAAVSNGKVVSLVVQNPGSGYTAGATLTIGAPPSNAFQTFPGVNNFGNPNNTFAGTFSGNGANLTGLSGGGIAAGTILGTALANNAVTDIKIADGQVVKSLNGLKDTVTLAAGTNVTLSANGSTLTVSAAAGNLAWEVVSGTNQMAQPNRGYIVTNMTETTIVLPTNPPFGSTVRVVSDGTGGWRVAQNNGQTIAYSNSVVTTAPVGFNWFQRAFEANWSALAASSNGAVMYGAVQGGLIQSSTNAGNNWSPLPTVSANWQSISCSDDGNKLVAAVNGGPIYVSSDSGKTWVAREASRNWTAIDCSSDGVKIVATVAGGQIYVSNDSGTNWTARDSVRNWVSVSCSPGGNNMLAAVTNGFLYSSFDSGQTWVPRDSIRGWTSVSISSGGAYACAATSGAGFYKSGDAVTWTLFDLVPGGQRGRFICGDDYGWNLVAGFDDSGLGGGPDSGHLASSINFGGGWTQFWLQANWSAGVVSGDGTHMVVAIRGGPIYTSTATTQLTTTSPGVDGFLSGNATAAVELLYIGNNRFVPVSFTPGISSY